MSERGSTAVSAHSLADLEAVIERGQRTFVEVGQALLEIREARLYQADHATFEDYCRERWGMSRVHAHRQIEAAEVVTVLPIGNTPAIESHVRELLPLKGNPEQMAAVWREVSANGQPLTAARIREAVAKRREPGEKRQASYDVTTPRGRQVANKAKLRIERAVGSCSALARAADDFRVEEAMAVASPAEIAGWLEVFTDARAALARLKRRIEEV